MLTGSFGEAGDPVYRLHQPAAGLVALEGVEVHKLLLPNQLPEVPPLQPRGAGPLRVGWGGSAGHLDDIRATAPVLVRWLQEHSDVRLEVMADPLLSAEYNACRSDVKFLEYTSRGAVPLLQRCATYAAVHEGDSGLLFGDGEELVAQLEALRSDPERRARLAQAAHAFVAGERLLAQQAPRQLAFYADLAERTATAAGSTATATAAPAWPSGPTSGPPALIPSAPGRRGPWCDCCSGTASPSR